MKKYFIAFLACMLSLVSDAFGQIVALTMPEEDEVKIGNVQVSKDSDNIYVDYDMLFGSRILSCQVDLEISLNAGKSFEKLIDGLSGDINNIGKPGHKQIAVSLNTYAKKLANKSLVFKVSVSNVVFAPFDYSNAYDLSSRGTANCYIVSSAGAFKFKPVKGNSSESVGSVSSVEVLWESFGTSQKPSVGDLIHSVDYDEGFVVFSTPHSFKEGNAVIAAKDASGTILWSWHIWLTDQPQGQTYYNNAGIMMDRNLGATSATPGDVCALGLLYQWGRKDPFLGSSSISRRVEAESTGIWPSAVSSSTSKGTAEYATRNPMTFITAGSSSDWDWHYSSRNNELWQSSKTINDPCPVGWGVPDGGDNGVWSKACSSPDDFYDYPYDSTDEGMNFSGKFGSASTIWYPASGFRFHHDGSLYHVGYDGSYWSAAPSSYRACYLYLDRNGNVYPSSSGGRARGRVVRCLQE